MTISRLTWSERCSVERDQALRRHAEHFGVISYFEALKVLSVDAVEKLLKHRDYALFSEWSPSWIRGRPYTP